MPITYCIIEELDLYYARWVGHVDEQHLITNIALYHSDRLFQRGQSQFIDLRQVVEITFGMPSIRLLVSKIKTHRALPNKVAKTVVLTGNTLTYGRARQYQSLAALQPGIEVHLTRSEFDALHLLGIGTQDVKSMLEKFAPGFLADSSTKNVVPCQ